jgi:polyisoprenoid-binding protein YceI
MNKIQWNADPLHTQIGFKVRHMMISHVAGTLSKFDINVASDDENFTNPVVSLTADVNSITTGIEQRDTHLKSSDFFSGNDFPQIVFKSTDYKKIDEEKYKLYGNLSMRGVTKPVILNVEYSGLMKDPWGNLRAGFTITGKINRKDWGLNYNAILEAGGVMVSEEVNINCEVELIKQAVLEETAEPA